MPTPDPMPPEKEQHLYLEGIRLFNDHCYFEAHEVWEEAWHMAMGVKHDFLQGLIQCAVALEHYRRSNPRGVVNLHRAYLSKFRNVPRVFMGLDLEAFQADMERALRPVLTAKPLPARGQIQLDVSATPTIVLDPDYVREIAG